MSDPSMEDILASIRKILADETMEEQNQENNLEPEATENNVSAPEEMAVVADTVPADDDVFDLSETEMLQPAIEPVIEPVATVEPVKTDLIDNPVAKASACTLTYLAQKIAEDKKSSIGNAGLTIEDIFIESIKPIIKEWLNQNLYDIVERLVRQEIEKVVDKVQV